MPWQNLLAVGISVFYIGFFTSTQSVTDVPEHAPLDAADVLGSPPPQSPEESLHVAEFPEIDENIRELEKNLEAIERHKVENEAQMAANAVLRDRLQNELNEEKIGKLFDENLEFLKVKQQRTMFLDALEKKIFFFECETIDDGYWGSTNYFSSLKESFTSY